MGLRRHSRPSRWESPETSEPEAEAIEVFLNSTLVPMREACGRVKNGMFSEGGVCPGEVLGA